MVPSHWHKTDFDDFLSSASVIIVLILSYSFLESLTLFSRFARLTICEGFWEDLTEEPYWFLNTWAPWQGQVMKVAGQELHFAGGLLLMLPWLPT